MFMSLPITGNLREGEDGEEGYGGGCDEGRTCPQKLPLLLEDIGGRKQCSDFH